jgi:predicted NBD/HSP70 family sugar kinase
MAFPGLPADSSAVRRHNLRLLLGALLDAAGSRAELSARTGLTKATVASLADALIAQGILHEGPAEISGPGRPARLLSISADGPLSIGVEVNVDYTSVCALDLTNGVRHHRQVPFDNRAATLAQIVEGAGAQVAAVIRELDATPLGIGWAVPAVVDADGVVLRAPNLPQLTGVQASALLSDALQRPDVEVFVDNEANLAALAESRADSAVGPSFVYVSGEIGVGAGLVIDGEVFRGYRGFAGELGHVVVEQDGPSCPCGGQGCVEQYAGQEVLLRATGRGDIAALTAALDAGDTLALSAVREAGAALGVGLASLLNVIDVPLIVLGGIYSRLYSAIVPDMQIELSRRVLAARYGSGQVKQSVLDSSAAVQGAAGLVLDRALRDPASLTGSRVAAIS